MLLQSRHFARWIIQVAKYDSLGRARLLAGSLNFSIPDCPVLLFGGDSRATDSLHTVSTFFHHAPPADRDLRVVHRLETRLPIICVLIEIEASHFVRAI